MLLEQQERQNCRMSSGSLNSLSSIKSNESLPGDKVEVRNISKMMKILEVSSDLPPIHSEGIIYSEPKVFQNAWRVHGYASDDDHAEREGEMSQMQFYLLLYFRTDASTYGCMTNYL